MFLSSKIFLKASLRLKLSWKECHGGLWWGARWAQVTNPSWYDSCASGSARLDLPLTSVARPVPECSHQGKGQKRTSSIDLTPSNDYKWVFKLGKAEQGGAQSGTWREQGRGIYQGLPHGSIRGPFSIQTIQEVGIFYCINKYLFYKIELTHYLWRSVWYLLGFREPHTTAVGSWYYPLLCAKSSLSLHLDILLKERVVCSLKNQTRQLVHWWDTIWTERHGGLAVLL